MRYFTATATKDQRVTLPCGAIATRGLKGYNDKGENTPTEVADAAAEHGYTIVPYGVTYDSGYHVIMQIVMQKET